MKKYLVLFLTICICLPCLALMGCGNSEAYKDTKNNLQAFYTNADYTDLITGNITYSTNISSKMNSTTINKFQNIKIFDQTLKACLTPAKVLYSEFNVLPAQNTGKISSVCKSLDLALENLTTEIANFKTAKTRLIEKVIPTTNEAVANLAVGDFKTTYHTLIEKAKIFNSRFIKAYDTLYGGIIDSETPTIDSAKSAILNTYNDLINTFFDYGFSEVSETYTTNLSSTDNYLDHEYYNNSFYQVLFTDPSSLLKTVENIPQKVDSLTNSNTNINTEKYSNWLNSYQLFQNELDMFHTALDKVDLTLSEENEKAEGVTKIYLTKINDFVITNAGMFMNETKTLLN